MSDREPEATLNEQEIPMKSHCPECGEPPTTRSAEQAIAQHRLSDVGYLHDDIRLTCGNEHKWTCGVPIGEFEAGDDLWCDSCDEAYMFTHRVAISKQNAEMWANGEREHLPLTVHLKCPNGCDSNDPTEKCFYFKQVRRVTDDRGVALLGYPPITGSAAEAEPYGWSERPGDGE